MSLWSKLFPPKGKSRSPSKTTFYFVIWQDQCWVSRQSLLRWLKNEIEWSEVNGQPDVKFLVEFFSERLKELGPDTAEEVSVGGDSVL